MARYVSPFTGFGFMRLFGQESSKELLKNFLNQLLAAEQGEIKDLTYLKGEQLGSALIGRNGFIDICCKNERGDQFIVELQKEKHNFFRERSKFYSSFPIQHLTPVGEWNFEPKAVYLVGILDFVFSEDRGHSDVVCWDSQPRSDNQAASGSFDKVTYIYLRLPKFEKKEDELENHFDKWLYVLKNLGNLTQRPAKLYEAIFGLLFAQADTSALTSAEREAYETSLKHYRDINNVIETARLDGYKAGLEQARLADRSKGLEGGLT